MKNRAVCKLICCLLTGALFLACKEQGQEADDYYTEAAIKTSKEFLIPRELKVEIEKEYLAFIRKENPKVVLPDQEITSRILREYLDVVVQLRAPSASVLSRNTRFALPRGGGQLDLKDVVKGKKGSFFMSLRAMRSNHPEEPLQSPRVYFLSETRTKKIGKEVFGVGCGSFMDVTSYFRNQGENVELQVNATDQRYVPVIGGVFYYVDFDRDRKIYLSAIRIEDTRYPELSCPPPESKE